MVLENAGEHNSLREVLWTASPGQHSCDAEPAVQEQPAPKVLPSKDLGKGKRFLQTIVFTK